MKRAPAASASAPTKQQRTAPVAVAPKPVAMTQLDEDDMPDVHPEAESRSVQSLEADEPAAPASSRFVVQESAAAAASAASAGPVEPHHHAHRPTVDDSKRLNQEQLLSFVSSYNTERISADQLRPYFQAYAKTSMANELGMKWILRIGVPPAARSVIDCCRSICGATDVDQKIVMTIGICRIIHSPQLMIRKLSANHQVMFQGAFSVIADVGNMTKESIQFVLNINELSRALESVKDSDKVEIMCHADESAVDVCIFSGEEKSMFQSHIRLFPDDGEQDETEAVVPIEYMVTMNRAHREFISMCKSQPNVDRFSIAIMTNEDSTRRVERLRVFDTAAAVLCSFTSQSDRTDESDESVDDIRITTSSMKVRFEEFFSFNMIPNIIKSLGKKSDSFTFMLPKKASVQPSVIDASTEHTKIVWFIAPSVGE